MCVCVCVRAHACVCARERESVCVLVCHAMHVHMPYVYSIYQERYSHNYYIGMYNVCVCATTLISVVM